jgi:uncharacterized membrane protein
LAPRARGFLRKADGTIVSIEVPGATASSANGIDAAGQIVGDYRTEASSHAFLIDQKGVLVTIDPPGAQGASAWDVNAAGHIIINTQEKSYVRDPH